MRTSSTSARFTRTGRAYHLDIATAADLRNALDLDEAHWVATSAPIDTLHLDALFLQLVDADHDGRIKPRELKDAIRWCLEVLCDVRSLDAGDERHWRWPQSTPEARMDNEPMRQRPSCSWTTGTKPLSACHSTRYGTFVDRSNHCCPK